ncbi:hypothetical protein F4775DRAFT_452229 [Biscogniauxia sp. FL1348]|nr:hypothetical protein F4775DRAFT_452229 [Biscogniauxia sp. FL1348]
MLVRRQLCLSLHLVVIYLHAATPYAGVPSQPVDLSLASTIGGGQRSAYYDRDELNRQARFDDEELPPGDLRSSPPCRTLLLDGKIQGCNCMPERMALNWPTYLRRVTKHPIPSNHTYLHACMHACIPLHTLLHEEKTKIPQKDSYDLHSS